MTSTVRTSCKVCLESLYSPPDLESSRNRRVAASYVAANRFRHVGRASPSALMTLTAGLPHRNLDLAEAELFARSDPLSPNFRQWFSTSQVMALTEPKQAVRDAVEQWFADGGASCVTVHAIMRCSATVTQVGQQWVRTTAASGVLPFNPTQPRWKLSSPHGFQLFETIATSGVLLSFEYTRKTQSNCPSNCVASYSLCRKWVLGGVRHFGYQGRTSCACSRPGSCTTFHLSGCVKNGPSQAEVQMMLMCKLQCPDQKNGGSRHLSSCRPLIAEIRRVFLAFTMYL